MKFSYVVAAILLYISYVIYYRPDGEFLDNKFKLGAGFTAKNYCSCLFVTENTQDECLNYAALDMMSPRLSVDYKNKVTQSVFFFFVSQKAQFIDEEKGCTLL